MLHHWATAASQVVICLLLWPGFTLADPVDGDELTYFGHVMNMNEAPAETLVKRDEGPSSASAVFEEETSTSAAFPLTSTLTPEAGAELQRMENFPRPQRGHGGGLETTVRRIIVYIFGGCKDPTLYLDDAQDSWETHDPDSDNLPSTSRETNRPSTSRQRYQPSRIELQDLPSTSRDGPISWQVQQSSPFDDESVVTPRVMPPEHQRIAANLTLYFGPFNPIAGLQGHLPHPTPTSYAADGTPSYEFWYEWPSGLSNRASRPRGPVQLVPKAAGCYNPAPGAMGSLLHDCPRRGVKDPFQGWAPCLPAFPGAPGSSWAFRAPRRNNTSPFSGTRDGLMAGQPLYQLARLRLVLIYMENTRFSPLLGTTCALFRQVLFYILTEGPPIRLARSSFRDPEVLAVLLMTYAPHFVDIILQLYDEMRRNHRDRREAPAPADQYLTRAFCSGMVDTIEESLASYNPPQNGLCITCGVTAQKADKIVLGNYTEQAFCDLVSTVYEHHGPHYSLDHPVTPSLYIQCEEPTAGDSCGGPPTGKGVGLKTTGPEDIAPYVFSGSPTNPKTNNMADDEPHTSRQRELTAAADGCSSVDELEFEIQFDGRSSSATRDSIYLVFNGDISNQVYVTKNAWSGYHSYKKIDIPKVFNKDSITFRDIHRVGLITKMEDDPRDGWGLKGIKLTATCASSQTKWQVDKYANVTRWMDREYNRKQNMAWVGTIQAKDWRKKTVFESCKRFDRLQLSIVRAPSGDGSQDAIHIGFGEEGKQAILLQVDKPGFQDWQNINILQIWDTKTVGIDQIRSIQIKQLHVGDVENRDWMVTSFKLRGSCAGSRTFTEYGLKLDNLLEHPDNFKVYSQDMATPFTTWHSPYIDSSKDWVLLHDCTRWDRLEVAVGFSGVVGRGTEDSIYVSFARDTKKAPSYLIQKRPWHNEWYEVSVDLQSLFKAKTIDMNDINYFRLYAVKDFQVVDRWRVTSVIFTARCADNSALRLINEQYKGIEKTIDALWDPPDNEISGEVDSSRWKWANPSVSGNVTIRVHDGSEF
ncbi:hypothetical protein GQ602_005310 [Ophiocordyceps camponoti-floridani]|uniref:Uncharacterized protein n=1 Tax=Ophiocordyceps camponoti-floridani TaxID=2030778 RepID=A0A8H4VCV6_9HYPO|nr:hypothetical protein GQ602_005310 [Ophiocordyceps camponoti-floridani]